MSKTAEQDFIKNNRLSVKSLLEVEDDKEFDRLNEKFYLENTGIEDSVIQAREALKEKEDALIAYALSIIPVKIADQLRHGLHIIVFRQKVIDTIMQLDSRTVPVIRL
jgi:phospholipid N-methyltransferase